MAYNIWLLVMFVMVFPLAVHGHEACYNNSWAYHFHSYSCFRLFQIEMTRPEARNYCHEVQLGSTYGVITRLAKIDDRNTDDYIRSLFPATNWSAWIGLYKNDEQNDYRWDGYPDEVPTYIEPWFQMAYLPYTATYIDYWRGHEIDFQTHFVCQHSSKKIGAVRCAQQLQLDMLNITCISDKSPAIANCEWTYKYDVDPSFGPWTPLNNPIHESHTESPGGNISYTTACSVSLSNFSAGFLMIKMKMYPNIIGTNLSNKEEALTEGGLDLVNAEPQKPTFSSPSMIINGSDLILVQGSSNVILTCSITTGSPAVFSISMDCESPITDTPRRTTNASQSFTVSVRQINRDMDGKKCTCWGIHLSGQTEISTLTFKVITMPRLVLCQRHLLPTGLQMSCQLDKIYPQAVSVWSYHQENEQNFNPVSADECSYESYTDSDGFLYYNSSCFLTLTNDTMTFATGDLTVQVTMNPNVEGIDETVTNNAFVTYQDTVNIDKPDKPQFKILDTTLQTSSPIHFHGNDRIDILCEVQSGKPSVLSVTLSCEFPFKDSDVDNKHTVSGTTYVMDEIAACNMDGKSCTCTGHHLTGSIESSPLTFNVTYPQVKSPASSSCLSTGSIVGLILASDVVVIILTILCMIAFRKLRERNEYKIKKTSGDGHINVGFHRPEQEAIGSGSDKVPADARFSGKDAPPLYKNMASKDDIEGEELGRIDTTMYEAMQHAEKKDDERAGNENYDIVHADDPSYINLKREPSRQYMTIDDQDHYHVYETPTPAK